MSCSGRRFSNLLQLMLFSDAPLRLLSTQGTLVMMPLLQLFDDAQRLAAADALADSSQYLATFLLHLSLQGTLVMMPLLPLSLATFNYGEDAVLFKPQRWMAGSITAAGAAAGTAATGIADDAAGERDQQQHAAAAAAAAAKGSSIAAPDPHTFMTGAVLSNLVNFQEAGQTACCMSVLAVPAVMPDVSDGAPRLDTVE
jgi:hypothetical protein